MPKQATTWLEPVLTQGLRRVAAPDRLWDGVELPRDPVIRPPGRAVSLRFACASSAVLLLVSAVSLHSYLKGAVPRSARATGSVHLPVLVSAACHLCHAGDDLQVGVSRGVY